MANPSKDKGTRAETAVARYLKAHGWPHAERRATNGSTDRGDITGCPGLVFEVKYRDRPPSDGQIGDWLSETERERANANADLGLLVVNRYRHNPSSWWAITPLWVLTYLQAMADRDQDGMPGFTGGADLYAIGSSDPTTPWMLAPVRMLLGDVVTLLRAAGYGDPVEVPRGDR